MLIARGSSPRFHTFRTNDQRAQALFCPLCAFLFAALSLPLLRPWYRRRVAGLLYTSPNLQQVEALGPNSTTFPKGNIRHRICVFKNGPQRSPHRRRTLHQIFSAPLLLFFLQAESRQQPIEFCLKNSYKI